ncbi:MAG: hypothetical protein JWP83_4886 [Mycobacterium sp.]|nr:hypothetical protein [Mycobacterium sp.]
MESTSINPAAAAIGSRSVDVTRTKTRATVTIPASRNRVSACYSPGWSSMMPSQICATSMATFSLMKACWVPV